MTTFEERIAEGKQAAQRLREYDAISREYGEKKTYRIAKGADTAHAIVTLLMTDKQGIRTHRAEIRLTLSKHGVTRTNLLVIDAIHGGMIKDPTNYDDGQEISYLLRKYPRKSWDYCESPRKDKRIPLATAKEIYDAVAIKRVRR